MSVVQGHVRHLERHLAAAVANDTSVADLYRESCREVDWDNELER